MEFNKAQVEQINDWLNMVRGILEVPGIERESESAAMSKRFETLMVVSKSLRKLSEHNRKQAEATRRGARRAREVSATLVQRADQRVAG